MVNYFILALILIFALPQDVTKAQDDQPGFISIDCGLQGPNYTNEVSGIYYTSDEEFVSSGVSKSVSEEYATDTDILQQYKTVRYFPEGLRNCYTLKPGQGKGSRYLIRARFMYGNYDKLNKPPKFDIHIGLQYWQTIEIANATSRYGPEIIHTPLSDYINVCLVKTGPGIPFISTLELRPLPSDMYEIAGVPDASLNLIFRADVNSDVNYLIRFPDDLYDRTWSPFTLTNTLKVSAKLIVNGNLDPSQPPSFVMSTAAEATNASFDRLRFRWDSTDTRTKYYMFLYFAELKILGAKELREFNIFLNDELWTGNVVPRYLVSTSMVSYEPSSGHTTYVVEINRTVGSTLPPILNAGEVYSLIEFPLQETHAGDVAGMLKIKSTYNITQNWQGDPCGPEEFQWIGVNCTATNSSVAPRITSLNLSSKKLFGSIAPGIFELKALQKLDLSNNNLTGTVPEFLAELNSLIALNLKGNNFSKPFPQQLLSKADSGVLKFEYDDGGSGSGDGVCQSDEPCFSNTNNKKKKSIGVLIGGAVGGVFFLICASLLIFCCIRSSKKPKATINKMVDTVEHQERRSVYDPNSTPKSPIMSQTSYGSPAISKSSPSQINHNDLNNVIAAKSRQFTYHEVLQITNNFQRVIGKGGFGTVYHGYVGDIQVAVKMLSPSSTQGYKEFQAEATLLLTIHHKNLTSLVGYCYEGTNMGILYEYMANGNLERHLLGNGPYVLTWEERLRMAMDAAQGLEYLHHGCKPAVVHRDVKITNILIDEKFGAKLADFGLSRAFPIEDATHAVSTVVAGTPGYLDPEYYSTTRLTEKSDIYSFGIVLLEIVTGRPALPRNNEPTHIIAWVSSEIEKGDLGNVVDPRLRGDYSVNAVWKVLEIAMSCVARNSTKRPTMNFVVTELKSCLIMETTRNQTESMDSIGLISMNMESGLKPQAR